MLRLTELFSEYRPREPLADLVSGAEVCAAQIDQAARRVTAQVRFAAYAPVAALDELQTDLSRRYGIASGVLEPQFPSEAVEQMPTSELTEVLRRAYAPARAILSGCRWERTAEGFAVSLLHNGKAELSPHLRHAESFLAGRFGGSWRVTIAASHELDAAGLLEQSEQLRQSAAQSLPQAAVREKPKEDKPAGAIMGRPFKALPTPISQITMDTDKVTVEGEVFAVNHKEIKKRGAWVINFDLTDYTGSVRVNQYMDEERAKPIIDGIKPGMWVQIAGRMSYSNFEKEDVLQPLAIQQGKKPQREDTAEEKRVELHLHTNMSNMDALTDTAAAVATAARWGHKAIAITDHGVVQNFPAALKAAKGKDIKVLYGCEAYFVNDVDDRVSVHGTQDWPTSGEFVAFDLETTGLSSREDEIIEIGAAIFRGGEIVDKFQTFVQPGRRLPAKIIELTGITDTMLQGAPDIAEVLPRFLAFCGDRPLAAHNADFDTGFIRAACRRLGLEYRFTSLDSLIMAQNLLPKLGKYKLNIVADALGLPDFQHHRAVDDAMTVAYMLQRFFVMLDEAGVRTVQAINPYMQQLRSGARILDRQARHMILFAKNNTGLRNLYRLVSMAHLNYFKRVPRIPKSELMRWREGLIIGSACESGELFQAIVDGKSEDELLRIASFYDFLEIQPLCNNAFMLANGKAKDEEQLREFNRTVVRLGEKLNKRVVATGDVHFLNPEDEIYRRLLLASKGFADCDRELPLYFKTTNEMLEEFSYLGAQKCYDVVIKNPNEIADMCDTISPVPKGLFAFDIDNAVQRLKDLVYGKLNELYDDSLPQAQRDRVETELGDILGRGYASIYMSAQILVQDSLAHGYLVGSRGSVGSSIVAYLSGITEVNAFPPHYRCPNCRHSDFAVPEGAACGADLPDAVCPVCGTPYKKDGFDIPFETFLGFGGAKVPDIDLNFSGEYQANAHRYTIELFGADHVFRAGTIGTVAEKTAYGYVMKYMEERSREITKAEENRLAAGCVGVKRTTGQHPGGLVVIPEYSEIYDFCPVQHPADSTDTDIITTHFEYHSMEENLLKLDMLGHDDPTMIRMLEDLTGVDAQKIPLDDPNTMSIFTSSKVLGFENDKILGPTGACAIPEFGTSFVRGMLLDTMPREFDTLIRISGFSHGTDVWLGNAKDLITSGTCTAKEAIGCRDDIMLYLISKGMDPKMAFSIMEDVRKGRVKKGGFKPGCEEKMRELGVPDWYIQSCRTIAYLFPKAHAVAYVMMAFRIAWFKVHEPLAFYSAYFYRRSQKDGFDAAMMTGGIESVKAKIKEISTNDNATAKEEDLLTTLEVCYEFYLRGFEFLPIDLYESDALRFNIKDGKLLPPFVSVSGLGETAALDIAEGRKGRQFLSVEEFQLACPKVSKTHIEQLRAAGAFGSLPETSQMTLF